MAKGSAKTWILLVANGYDEVEIGVILGNTGVENVPEDEGLKINGEPIHARFTAGTGMQWLPTRKICVPIPPTYEVSFSLNLPTPG